MPAKDPPRFTPELEALFADAKQSSDAFTQRAAELCDYVAAFEARLCSLPGKVQARVDNLDEKPETSGRMPLRLTFKRTAESWGLYIDDARRSVDELDASTLEVPGQKPPPPIIVAPAAPFAPVAPTLITVSSKPKGPTHTYVVPNECRLATEASLPIKAEAVELFPKLLTQFIAETNKNAAALQQAVVDSATPRTPGKKSAKA